MLRLVILLTLTVLISAVGPATAFAQPGPAQSILQEGWAYRYSPLHEGRRTTLGEIYADDGLTAAHRTLPLGATVRVTSMRSGQSVVVRVNDRGPYVPNRVIDLSGAAARAIGLPRDGGYVRIALSDGSIGAQARAAIDLEDERDAADEVVAAQEQEYTIQLGSFSDESTARRLAESIEGGWFYRVRVDNVWVYRVNFGVYLDRPGADRAREALVARGMDGFVKIVEDSERQRIVEN